MAGRRGKQRAQAPGCRGPQPEPLPPAFQPPHSQYNPHHYHPLLPLLPQECYFSSLEGPLLPYILSSFLPFMILIKPIQVDLLVLIWVSHPIPYYSTLYISVSRSVFEIHWCLKHILLPYFNFKLWFGFLFLENRPPIHPPTHPSPVLYWMTITNQALFCVLSGCLDTRN